MYHIQLFVRFNIYINFSKGYLIIMNKYFTIMLATVMTSLAVTSSAHAWFLPKPTPRPTPCRGVSEPAAAMVALTALGLFVAARRRKSV